MEKSYDKEKKKASDKKYYKENKEKISERKKEYNKEYREKNKEKISEYRKSIKEKQKDYFNSYYTENSEKFKLRSKKQREENRELLLEYGKLYYKENKERWNNYKNENIERIRLNRRTSHSIKIKNDPLYKLKHNIRGLIHQSILKNGYSKKSKTLVILGCSFEEFKQHLESYFEPWMNWGNHGLYNGDFNYGWDIDHIVPSSSALTEDDVYKLNHYTNLKPLCSKINRDIKKDKH